MRRPRFTYANVTASLALFLALGGISFAATSLPANSVGSRQLRGRSVTAGKLARSATSRLRGPRGRSGPAGTRGVDGHAGAAGRAGTDGHDGAPGAPGPSFGSFVHVATETLAPCSDQDIADVPFSVTRASRLVTLVGAGTVQATGANQRLSIQSLVEPADSLTILGLSPGLFIFDAGTGYQTDAPASGGIVARHGDATQPLDLAPGDYRLVVRASASGACSGDASMRYDATVTYFLTGTQS